MGNFLTLPVNFKDQESIEKEAKRLIHSYECIVKKLVKQNELNKLIEYRQKNIYSQWHIIFPLLHNKNIYYNRFFKVHMEYLALTHQEDNNNNNSLTENLLG